MNEITYLRPQSLREALVLLKEYRDRAVIMAGGTDLLARLKKRQATPQVVINIQGIHELEYIHYHDGEGLHIGALTPLSYIEKSATVCRLFPVLGEAAGLMASPSIRCHATIGGNLGNAAPSADIVPALLVLDAVIITNGIQGEKKIPVDKFFTGPGVTVLQPGEIISEIFIPELTPGSRAVYLKQKRREGADLAVAGVAVMLTMNMDEHEDTADRSLIKNYLIIKEIKIALAAVAPTPIRAGEAEKVLRGKNATRLLIDETGRVASSESKPIDDVRSSADYRRKLVAVLTTRAIRQAIKLEYPEEHT